MLIIGAFISGPLFPYVAHSFVHYLSPTNYSVMPAREDCNIHIVPLSFVPDLVIRGSSLTFSRGGLIFIPPIWLFEVGRLPFPEMVILSCHPPFHPSLLGLSFSTRAQMHVTWLGLNHAYLIEFRPGSQ